MNGIETEALAEAIMKTCLFNLMLIYLPTLCNEKYFCLNALLGKFQDSLAQSGEEENIQ